MLTRLSFRVHPRINTRPECSFNSSLMFLLNFVRIVQTLLGIRLYSGSMERDVLNTDIRWKDRFHVMDVSHK
jgi:hypothetical protein